MLLKNPWVRKLREANTSKRDRMQEDCETEMCEVQMESLRKAKADTSNCVPEDCQKGAEEE